METPNTIKSMLASGQSQRVEFKTSDAGLDLLGATICAFLNSGGGQIVVGVRDDGAVEGKVKASRIEELLRPLAGGEETDSLLTPNAIWDVSEEAGPDGTVVIIDVPAGSDFPYVFRDTIYVRVGTETHEATGKQVRALIERRYLRGPRWERQPALEVGLQDLDERQIEETVDAAVRRRGWRFRNRQDLRMVLEDLKLIEQGRITHAAVVLFAKEAGHILPQAHVRMTAFGSDSTGSELLEDQVSRGHLFSHLEAYEAFIRRQIAISSDLTASQPQRVDRPQYPYWSLREGFRNALIHRGYDSVHGRISVGLYPDKFVIWSHGDLPPGVTIGSLKEGDRSMPVNPDIAQVVFLRGLVELIGRGTRKMVEEFKSRGLPEPVWRRQTGGIALTLRPVTGAPGLKSGLSVRQVWLLRSIRPGETTDLAKYRKESGNKWSERAMRNDFAHLVRLGHLARMGRGKSTFYVRTEKPAG